MASHDKPVWFITGCSTGFGTELAKLVLQRGYCAIVTARDPQEISYAGASSCAASCLPPASQRQSLPSLERTHPRR
jgi:NADP-dependent 3-hydroxy acid dehydrogenase YdfG